MDELGDEMGAVVKCLKCERVLDEPTDLAEAKRKPCPACGSLSRHFEVEFKDSMTLHDHLDAKEKQNMAEEVVPFLKLERETIYADKRVSG